MARKPRFEKIQCKFFCWRLFQRAGVYYADGRGSGHDLGKHSLGSRDRNAALTALQILDQHKAFELGLTSKNDAAPPKELSIEQGWAQFMANRERPQVLGGIGSRSIKRYCAIRDKHIAHCRTLKIHDWSQIDRNAALNYGAALQQKYAAAPATVLLELSTLCSVVKFLVEQRTIPAHCRFSLGLPKIQDSDTYAYHREEVHAMVELCRADPKLGWLCRTIIGLATTGMRIGELVSLRRSDIDFDANVITLTDERFSYRRAALGNARTTKGKRGRSIPLNPELRAEIQNLPVRSDGLVFHGARGGRLKPDVVRTALIRDVISPLKGRFPTLPGQIGFEHGRVHSFRHYFVSEAFRLGVPEARVMQWVGHRDSRIVARYRHLRDDEGQQTMQRLSFLQIEERPDGPGAKA